MQRRGHERQGKLRVLFLAACLRASGSCVVTDLAHPVLHTATDRLPAVGKALVECANKVAENRGQPGVVVGYEEIAEAAFG